MTTPIDCHTAKLRFKVTPRGGFAGNVERQARIEILADKANKLPLRLGSWIAFTDRCADYPYYLRYYKSWWLFPAPEVIVSSQNIVLVTSKLKGTIK